MFLHVTFSTQSFCGAWNGTLWAAGGMGTNTLAYSYDGLNWPNITPATSPFSTLCNGIAWNGTLFVAVGTGTNIMVVRNINI